MKEHTVKLSGHAKDRFLERFFADESALDADLRQRLTQRSKSAFSSLRVRKAILARQRDNVPPKPRAPSRSPSQPVVSLPPAEPPRAPSPVAAPAAQADAAFDAYAVKLVPIFQREGRDGLHAKLGGVTSVDHLRQMAKAQQIVLPQELRTGDASAEAIRAGIVEAVAKRIADRRAAAG